MTLTLALTLDPNPSPNQAAAERLHEAGEARWGTSEEVFIEILAGASPRQAAAISRHYENKYDRSLAKAILTL